MEKWIARCPGMVICFLIATISWYLGKLFPVAGGAVFAILIGMVIALFYKDKGKAQEGIQYTSKKILQLAVVLLGFGLNLFEVANVGLTSLPIILSTILTSLLVAYFLQKLLKLPSRIAALIGVGSSICGGSAIAATAPVIEADDAEIAQSISVIFLFNVIAALIFPALGGLLDLSNDGFALFAGTAVNDTSSVTAAAASWDGMHVGANTLEMATIVKLTRTLAIIPITFVLACLQMKKQKGSGNGSFQLKKVFPMFVLFFVLASLLTTICTGLHMDTEIFGICKELSKFFIMMAMAAVGLNTNLMELIRNGGKAIILGGCCWVAIAAVSLSMQYFLDLL